MKYKLLAAVLVLTVMSWAQTTTQSAPSTPQQSTVPADKAKCGCCDKMAATDAKDAHACCAHHDKQAKDSKEMASCCAGKDAKSDGKDAMACMKADKDKTATASCGDCCSKDHEKGCCASHKKDDKTAMNCCEKECGEHCASHASAGASK
jgi:hypothetical protein